MKHGAWALCKISLQENMMSNLKSLVTLVGDALDSVDNELGSNGGPPYTFSAGNLVVMSNNPLYQGAEPWADLERSPHLVQSVVNIDPKEMCTVPTYGSDGRSVVPVEKLQINCACHHQFVTVEGIRFSGHYFRPATAAEVAAYAANVREKASASL